MCSVIGERRLPQERSARSPTSDAPIANGGERRSAYVGAKGAGSEAADREGPAADRQLRKQQTSSMRLAATPNTRVAKAFPRESAELQQQRRARHAPSDAGATARRRHQFATCQTPFDQGEVDSGSAPDSNPGPRSRIDVE